MPTDTKEPHLKVVEDRSLSPAPASDAAERRAEDHEDRVREQQAGAGHFRLFAFDDEPLGVRQMFSDHPFDPLHHLVATISVALNVRVRDRRTAVRIAAAVSRLI